MTELAQQVFHKLSQVDNLGEKIKEFKGLKKDLEKRAMNQSWWSALKGSLVIGLVTGVFCGLIGSLKVGLFLGSVGMALCLISAMVFAMDDGCATVHKLKFHIAKLERKKPRFNTSGWTYAEVEYLEEKLAPLEPQKSVACLKKVYEQKMDEGVVWEGLIQIRETLGHWPQLLEEWVEYQERQNCPVLLELKSLEGLCLKKSSLQENTLQNTEDPSKDLLEMPQPPPSRLIKEWQG